jgi:beta-glucanase (GH16 family)
MNGTLRHRDTTEWNVVQAITTENGKLVITLSEIDNHNLNFQSGVYDMLFYLPVVLNYFIPGMLTSWNKLCFTTGYIEMSISLPGSPSVPGLWPGASADCLDAFWDLTSSSAAWTMGNLVRIAVWPLHVV